MKQIKKEKINVLIVEDSETSGILLKSLLEENNKYVVQVVNSAKEAVSIDKSEFDLILLDIMMPDINGFEVLKKIKADEKTKDIPVVMVSAKNAEADINLAKSLGATSYITKPVEERTFLQHLELI